ncbi:hypothetical protein MLD38_007545 [Melastoma candidum]|uniref:Uncharacterized protein n=1 Tax=Melastoma candidum TaxID=119954 RepID=A0ACB9RTD2_9MYRT|nr:hypothetical protein MLD38_007545 [Melastoma candidum]
MEEEQGEGRETRKSTGDDEWTGNGGEEITPASAEERDRGLHHHPWSELGFSSRTNGGDGGLPLPTFLDGERQRERDAGACSLFPAGNLQLGACVPKVKVNDE